MKKLIYLIVLILAPTSGSAASVERNEHTAQTGTRVLIVGGQGLFRLPLMKPGQKL